MAKTKTILKFFVNSWLNLKTGSINPAWIADESLALKILIILPLSPEKSGTKAKRLGLLSRVLTELFKIDPAETPKTDERTKTGVDCFIIFFISVFDLYPK